MQGQTLKILEEMVKFLTLLRGSSAISRKFQSVRNFFDDYFFGLPLCLRMSATSIKRMLIDN